jgi:hypothetical protein
MSAMIIAGLRIGTQIHISGERFVRNTADELTPDVVETLTARGYRFVEDISGDAQSSADEYIAELQRKHDYYNGVLAEASAKGDWPTYYKNQDPARTNDNLLSDAKARAKAPAPPAVV